MKSSKGEGDGVGLLLKLFPEGSKGRLGPRREHPWPFLAFCLHIPSSLPPRPAVLSLSASVLWIRTTTVSTPIAKKIQKLLLLVLVLVLLFLLLEDYLPMCFDFRGSRGAPCSFNPLICPNSAGDGRDFGVVPLGLGSPFEESLGGKRAIGDLYWALLATRLRATT